MKVITTPPVVWETGEIFTPEDQNRVYLYAKDAISDVAEKRFTRSPLVLPFVTDVGSAYTEALTAENRSYLFICPTTCIIERAFLHANMTSNAEVQVNITKLSGGATPDGATTPWLSSGGAIASAAEDTEDNNQDRILLEANTPYVIAVTSSGTFTLERFDVVLHLLTDRWLPSGTLAIPLFSPVLVTDESPRNASFVTSNNSALATEAAKFAANKLAPAPFVCIKHGVLSTTDADLLRFTLPRFSDARAQAVVRRLYVAAAMTDTTGGTVSATLKDAGGATLASVSQNMAGITRTSKDSGAISHALAGSGKSPATTGDDYRIELANTSATNNALWLLAFAWISR